MTRFLRGTISAFEWLVIWGLLIVGLSVTWRDRDDVIFPDPESVPGAPSGQGAYDEHLVSDSSPAPRHLQGGTVSGERKQPGESYVGTAFALIRDEIWITARHVVDNCSRISLETPRGYIGVREVYNHAAADASLLVTGDSGSSGLPISRERAESRRNAREGFAMGFPQGRPGALHAERLTAISVRVEADFRSSNAAWGHFWAVERWPIINNRSEIGGISGGPIIGSDGDVDGIIVGSNPRRARVISIDPAYIFELARAANAETNRSRGLVTINRNNFDRAASQLLDDGYVRKVYCLG